MGDSKDNKKNEFFKEEKKETKESVSQPIDIEKVDEIVRKIKEKYKREGIVLEEAEGKIGDIRSKVIGDQILKGYEGSVAQLSKDESFDMVEYYSPLAAALGKIYLSLKDFFDFFLNKIKNLSFVKSLAFQLYCANIRLSVHQYLAISLVACAIAFILSLLLSFVFISVLSSYFEIEFISTDILGIKLLSNFLLSALFAFAFSIFVFCVALLLPSSIAKKRADDLNTELPFALRHMATQVKSGVGLYKTLQTIASSDYGVLSEEFARTIREVEEGTDIKDALEHFAIRTNSKALKSAILQMLRAMRTGGNLSTMMTKIAEDVSFELTMKVRDFGEKLNFFGVLFIVGAIVFPVFVALLGAISSVPFGFLSFSLPVSIFLFFYFVFMPVVLIIMTFYLKMIEPKV
ncbi:MAG: type II secretion system F family protein [Candidatus Diapherotrites archaeon]|nr:type II secretion system F family protein [Candidatus Diapherotrites archaeon]